MDLMAKLTDMCNMRCKYCYNKYYNNRTLDSSLFEHFLNEALSYDKKDTTILFTGGEALVAGKNKFFEILEIENKLSKKYNVNISNHIQTNGTLIDKDSIEILKKGDFGIGVSLDGPKDLHDSSRTYSYGRGTYDDIISGIGLLEKECMDYSILCVINKNSVGREKDIFDEFEKLKSNRIKFSIFIPVGQGNVSKDSLYINPEELGAFYTTCFDLWIENKTKNNLVIDPFHNLTKCLIGSKSDSCDTYRACGTAFLALDLNGDIYTCLRSIGHETHRLGNINESNLKQIVSSFDCNKFDFCKIKECQNCEYTSFCNGGCSMETLPLTGRIDTPHHYCASKKMLIKHAISKLTELGVLSQD